MTRFLPGIFIMLAVIRPVEAQDQDSLEALYWHRIAESRTKFVQAEVDFMIGMIAHHAQALVMSALVPRNGASSSVSVLAARIINAQKDEIQIMQTWLRDRGQASPEVHAGGHMPGGMHHMMPGMLTQEQLDELRNARGTEFDRLFLTYMIQHHKGAVVMVRELYAQDGTGGDEEAFKLASAINVDQITEIARMEEMLTERAVNSSH